MLELALILSFALLLSGMIMTSIVIFWRAVRGVVVDGHPLCRKCRYDLIGSGPDVRQCPECGAYFMYPGSILYGNRRSDTRQVGLAVMLLSFAICPLVLVGLTQPTAVAAIAPPPAPAATLRITPPATGITPQATSPARSGNIRSSVIASPPATRQTTGTHSPGTPDPDAIRQIDGRIDHWLRGGPGISTINSTVHLPASTPSDESHTAERRPAGALPDDLFERIRAGQSHRRFTSHERRLEWPKPIDPSLQAPSPARLHDSVPALRLPHQRR